MPIITWICSQPTELPWVESQPCKADLSPTQGSYFFSLKLDVGFECFPLLCLELLHVHIVLSKSAAHQSVFGVDVM